jgi:hypothetical protein
MKGYRAISALYVFEFEGGGVPKQTYFLFFLKQTYFLLYSTIHVYL